MDRHTGRQIHTYTDGENRLSKYPGSGLKEEGGESVFQAYCHYYAWLTQVALGIFLLLLSSKFLGHSKSFLMSADSEM